MCILRCSCGRFTSHPKKVCGKRKKYKCKACKDTGKVPTAYERNEVIEQETCLCRTK